MKKILCFALLASTLTASAQPKTNDDGTVTFRYQNDTAKTVLVDVQFAGRKEMTRGADGTWTVTLGPAAPDMYPYCYIVDGVSVMDPENPQYFPNEGFKNRSLGATNHAVVYLPPGYMMNREKKYPVFYLISGTTDTEEVYYKVGRVNYILDNLLAAKQAKEMIVVLPYGNPMKLKLQDDPTTASGATKERNEETARQMRFGGDFFNKTRGDLALGVDVNIALAGDHIDVVNAVFVFLKAFLLNNGRNTTN